MRRSLGIYGKATYPEGLAVRIQVEPILLNIDSAVGASLIMLSSLAGGFMKKLGQRMSGATAEQNDVLLDQKLSKIRNRSEGVHATTCGVNKKKVLFEDDLRKVGRIDMKHSPRRLSNAKSSNANIPCIKSTAKHSNLKLSSAELLDRDYFQLSSSESSDETGDLSIANDNDSDIDEETATQLFWQNEKGWIEGSTTEFTTSEALANLAQSIDASLSVEVELVQIQLWQSAEQHNRLCFAVSIEDIKLSGGLTATHQFKPWGVNCKLNNEKYMKGDSREEQPPWWTKLNEPGDVFGSNFSNLSFASYSFSNLDDSPFKVKPPAPHQLFDVIRRLVVQLLNSNSPSTGDEDNDGSQLLGDVRRVLWRVRHAPPWVLGKGSARFNATFLNRSEELRESFIEPVDLQFVCAQPRVMSPLQISCNTSWMNAQVNVALLDIFLVFGCGIIQRMDTFWDALCLKQVEEMLAARETAKQENVSHQDNRCVSLEFPKRNKNGIGKTSPQWCYELNENRRNQTPWANEIQSVREVRSFAWEVRNLSTAMIRERTNDRFDCLRALVSTLKIGLLRDNVGPSERYLSPSANFLGMSKLALLYDDHYIIQIDDEWY